jgi:hypothetical protein
VCCWIAFYPWQSEISGLSSGTGQEQFLPSDAGSLAGVSKQPLTGSYELSNYLSFSAMVLIITVEHHTLLHLDPCSVKTPSFMPEFMLPLLHSRTSKVVQLQVIALGQQIVLEKARAVPIGPSHGAWSYGGIQIRFGEGLNVGNESLFPCRPRLLVGNGRVVDLPLLPIASTEG